MIRFHHTCILGAALVAISIADWTAEGSLNFNWIPEAHAIVGAPLTPVSVAGVARRSTRRTVAVASTTAAASASAATASAAASSTAPAAAPAAGALPIGTVVAALPAGCQQMTSGGVQYYKCGADYYRVAFQGTNLVYVTAQP